MSNSTDSYAFCFIKLSLWESAIPCIAMKNILLLPLSVLLSITLYSCDKDEPNPTPEKPGTEQPSPENPGNPESPDNPSKPDDTLNIIVNNDETTSSGAPFKWIDPEKTTFMYNYIKYKIVDSHIEVVDTDESELPIALKGVVNLIESITINNYKYYLRVLARSCFFDSKVKTIIIPKTVTEIREVAFSKCSLLESVTILGDVKIIEGGAFNDCVSLKKITLPESLESLERDVFTNCSSLESLTLPPNLKGYYEFKGCTSLKSMTLLCSNINRVSSDENLYLENCYSYIPAEKLSIDHIENLYVPYELLESYKSRLKRMQFSWKNIYTINDNQE